METIDTISTIGTLWPLLFGFVSLVIVLAKMHYAIGVHEEKIKVAFELINKQSEHKHD